MTMLNDYFTLQQKIYDHFGYQENWQVIPFYDASEYFWKLDCEEHGVVKFARTVNELANETGEYYENEIYNQQQLQKCIYRAHDYTMVCVDTKTDGNKFLQIFDNTKERSKALNYDTK